MTAFNGCRLRLIPAAALLILGGSIGLPRGLSAQSETTVTANPKYEVGPVHSFVLGSNYRELWGTPVRVQILNPGTFAGGLTFLQEGGGRQTRSLRFAGADGRQYVFRSVDKEQSGGLHPDLQGTLVDWVVQDQVSAKHPGAALIVAPLLAAAGVLHADPTLYVMADHPALGEYREDFAGMFGIIEVRPDPQDGGAFEGFETVESSEDLLEALQESSNARVDREAYLRVRLMDLLVGDWDRHLDQWRWAEVEEGDVTTFLPIPRDRDNAFYKINGVIGTAGKAVRPFVVEYGPTYSNRYGLTYNGQELDRRFLPQIPRQRWGAIAADLQTRLTDDVIDSAVRQLLPEYYALSGPELTANLKARRDSLPQVAQEFYQQVMTEVDVRGSDEAERLTVTRNQDGSVAVALAAAEAADEPFYDRLFIPAETREVRVYLEGGADQATVNGSGPETIKIRIIGGEGNDRLEDQLVNGRAFFYDDGGENSIARGRRTVLDTRSFIAASSDTLTQNNQPPARDWGESQSLFAPTGEWRSDIGVVIGAGPTWTRYGFRRHPFATQFGAAVRYAPLRNRLELAAHGRRILTGGGGETRGEIRATQISQTRFHGYGNRSVDGPQPDDYRVWANEVSGFVDFARDVRPHLEIFAGPRAAYVDPDPVQGSPADLQRPVGSETFGVAGGAIGTDYDRRDSVTFPRRGFRLVATAEGYPLQWGDATEPFIRSELTSSVYLPVPFPLETTFALRAGGQKVWGEAPFQYGAFLGGMSSIRGHRTDRFVGDASVFGTVEARTAITRANLLIARGDVGTIALVESGRVFLGGEDSSEWHTAAGGGLWFGSIERKYTAHLVYVHGERGTWSAGVGVPF